MLTVNLNTSPPWGKGPARKIIDAMGGADYIMAVGGCVRDWLSDYPVKDMDFATKHFPNKSLQILKKKGFNVKPTGIKHGTVVVVIDDKTFEITSLRKDIVTDGRHASVEFGKDWYQDASRRDFTVNALYSDERGTVYDPLGTGFKDLKDNKLCFIGNPDRRIEEDYLRILRYFRFIARFSQNIDDMSLKSCVLNAKSITHLSGERVFSEFSNILISKDAQHVINTMQEHGMLKYLFTRKKIYNLYCKEQVIENFFKYSFKKHKLKNKFLVFISFLFNDEIKDIYAEIVESIVSRFNFSKNDKKLIFRNLEWIKNNETISPIDIKIIWLDCGKDDIEDLKLILKIINYKRYNNLGRYLNTSPPRFPCSGEDAKRVGFVESDEIGLVLKNIRQWWLENNCVAKNEECMEQLKEKFKSKKQKNTTN